jgi:hypothetical protein
MAQPIHQQQQAMSLEQDNDDDDKRKAEGVPEGEPLAKRQKPLEEQKTERKTPSRPKAIEPPANQTWIKDPSTSRFYFVKKLTFRLSEEKFNERPLHHDEYIKDDSGVSIRATFCALAEDPQEPVAMYATIGGSRRNLFTLEHNELVIKDFSSLADRNEDGSRTVDLFVDMRHVDYNLLELASSWRVRSLFDELPRYAKPVRVLAKDRQLVATIHAYDVEYYAPALAQGMRFKLDQNPDAETIDFLLGDDVPLKVARFFLTIVIEGNVLGWTLTDDKTKKDMKQVLILAHQWLVADKPCARSTHTVLYEALLDEIVKDITSMGFYDVELRIDFMLMLVRASKDGASPRLYAKLATIVNDGAWS